MIGAAIGGIASLAGAAAQAQAANTSAMIQYMNLLFQKENARKQHRLATAGRTDAFGNKQRFDDLLNEWKMELTPTQSRLVKGGEAEQLRSLTEDAPRNRAIKVAQHERGLEAGKDYSKVLADYRFNTPKSELALRDELQNLMAGATREQGKAGQSNLIRAALRLGRGGDVASIVKATDDAGGAGLAKTMLAARSGGLQESAARSQRHASEHLPLLQQLQATMDMGGDMPVRFSDTPDKMAALQSEQMKGIMAALQSEGSQVGGAYKGYADAVAKTAPDLKGLASLFSGIGKGMGGGKAQPGYGMMGGYTQDPLAYEEDRFRGDDYGYDDF